MACRLTLLILFISLYPLYTTGQCNSSSNGFTDVSLLSTEGAITVPQPAVRLYLFFSVNFTCDLNITSFTLLAADNGQTRTLYPRLQIWRKNGDLYNLNSSVGNINSEVATINSTHYLYTPTSGSISVMSGDILGVLVPTVSEAIIVPYFFNDNSSPTYYNTTFGLDRNMVFTLSSFFNNEFSPLVAFETVPSVTTSSIISTNTVISSSFTPTFTITSTVDETTIMDSMTSTIDTSTTVTTTSTTVDTSSSNILDTTSTSTVIPTSSDTGIPTSTGTSISPTTPSLSSTDTMMILTTLPSFTPTITSTDHMESSFSSPPFSSSSPPPPPTEESPVSGAVVGGLVVAGTLIIVIIGLVFVLVLLFGMGRKRAGKKRSFSLPPVEPEPLDNPNYSAVGNYIPPSVASTLTGDRFVTHYDIPGYQDPHSPVQDENHYDQANIDGGRITAFYDEARTGGVGGAISIYHELGAEDIGEGHYEMNTEFVYETANGAPSGYEKPVSSRSNSVKAGTSSLTNGGHSTYDVIPDDMKSSALPHKYSVLTTKDICVPTEEERQGMTTDTHLYNQISLDSEKLYSQLEVLQKQKYENIKFFEESDIYWKPAADRTVLYDQLARRKYREIRQSQLRITKHLGSGQFGTVNEGVWQSPNGLVSVAIKMLAENSDEEQKIKLLQEAAIMGQFCHPNVVKLHGVVTVGEPVMIVMDLMRNGDLRNHLIGLRSNLGRQEDINSLPQKLLQFCKQIAKGMNYLSRKSFVHRDLAARNIFLDDDHICKIGDFGMSRDLEDDNYYISHGGQIPIKWTAPEALQYKRYAPPSDVWSYGAVLYEIWSLGHKPFEGFSNPQAVDMVQSGYRLPPPPGCPRAVYQMMIHCWHPDSSRRPNFTDIIHSLSEENLLSWRDIDRSVHKQASILGSALEAGQDLYPELQQTFLKNTIKK